MCLCSFPGTHLNLQHLVSSAPLTSLSSLDKGRHNRLLSFSHHLLSTLFSSLCPPLASSFSPLLFNLSTCILSYFCRLCFLPLSRSIPLLDITPFFFSLTVLNMLSTLSFTACGLISVVCCWVTEPTHYAWF